MASIQSTNFESSLSPLGLGATSNMARVTDEGHRLATDFEAQ